MTKRINPESGIIEEKIFDVCGFDVWTPADNSEGNIERINPDTGVHEEKALNILGILEAWVEKD